MKLKHLSMAMILMIGFLLTPINVKAETFSAKAALNASSVTTGEAVQLNITVEGTTLASEPVVNEVDGLEISSLGRSSNVNYINGKYTALIGYRYQITGVKPGSYTLGPFEIKIKNKKLTTNSVTIQVNAAVGQEKKAIDIPKDSSPLGDKLFMKMEIGKTRLYLGEKTPLKIKVYFSEVTINDWNYPAINQSEFVLDPMNNPSQRKVIINGRTYQVVEFSSNLTPVKSGKCTLGPALLNFAVLIKQQASDAFYSSFKKYPIELKSNPININVLPLPASGRPVNFSGGIGRFQIKASGQPSEILQGEPVTLRLTVTGSGNLKTVGPPSLAINQGLKVYDPQKKKTDSGETGQIIYEQVVIPTDPKVKQLGPFDLAYFDPYQGKYVKATAPAIPVKVKPNPNYQGVLFSDDAEKSDESYGKDLIFIKEQLGDVKRPQDGLIYQNWFWWLQLIPIIGLLITFAFRKYQTMLHSDTPRSRALRASSRAAKDLAKVKAELTRKPENTLEALHLIVREYLAERFQLTAVGITGDVVERIGGHGIGPDALGEIKEFFDQYDFYRFTGNKIGPTEAGQLWEKVRALINILDQVGGYNQKEGKMPERRGQNERV